MRGFDLGQEVATPAAELASCTIKSATVEVQVLACSPGGSSAAFGRRSNCDICLRVEPADQAENVEASCKISGRHFAVAVGTSGRLRVVDESTNGTAVNGRLLGGGEAAEIDGAAEVDVGGVLRLRLTVEAGGGMVQNLLVERVDNLPERRYLLLWGAADIGGPGTPLPLVAATPPSAAGRGFDLGADDAGAATATRLLCKNGGIWIESGGNVSLDGERLGGGMIKPLRPGELEIAGAAVTVTAAE